MEYIGPEQYRELCAYLGEPYRDSEGFGLWGALRQRDREFAGWDQDVITGLLILRAGLWGDTRGILEIVERFAPVYGAPPLTLRELHRARLSESTLGRVHLRGEAWARSRPRLYSSDAAQGPEALSLLSELKLPGAGRVGIVLTRCQCQACAPDADHPADWKLFELFDPAGPAPDFWRSDMGDYTPITLDDPRDLAIVEGAVYLWAEELSAQELAP